MFDLPTRRADEKRAYLLFKKGLEALGFLRLQNSVYARLVLSRDAADPVVKRVREMCPRVGEVVTFVMTERQYAKREVMLGSGSCAQEVSPGEQMALVL